MSEGHGLAGAQYDVQCACTRPTVLASVHRLEDLVEVSTFDQAHREVHIAPGIDAELVYGNDARVIQSTGDLRLLEETSEPARIPGRRRGRTLGLTRSQDHLHRQPPAQAPIPDLVDRAHPATGDLFADVVAGRRG